MKFQIDHDCHIHSYLSTCSADPEQTKEALLKYGEENGFRHICLTDHYWDETVAGASDWYKPQDTRHVEEALPLPSGKNTKFHFGCETEMDKFFHLGISRERMERFELIIIPTTHLHMTGFTIDPEDDPNPRRRELYLERFERLLAMDLPFEKIGIAHLTCRLIAKSAFERHIEVIDGIPDDTFARLFAKCARKGVGIELNFNYGDYREEDVGKILRPYRIAKREGCKFYFGSDAHHPRHLVTAKGNFEKIANALELEEEDKFRPFRE